jgi:hypothetical protein
VFKIAILLMAVVGLVACDPDRDPARDEAGPRKHFTVTCFDSKGTKTEFHGTSYYVFTGGHTYLSMMIQVINNLIFTSIRGLVKAGKINRPVNGLKRL